MVAVRLVGARGYLFNQVSQDIATLMSFHCPGWPIFRRSRFRPGLEREAGAVFGFVEIVRSGPAAPSVLVPQFGIAAILRAPGLPTTQKVAALAGLVDPGVGALTISLPPIQT